jgi:CRISPR-associated endonuclease/helicase Cas3
MLRNNTLPIADVLLKFQTWYQQKFTEVGRSTLNDLRAEVYQHCLEAAEQNPGFFRLTVPTGGGKTLASLGFALRHADRYDFERIIYAIPYTSITEQTTNVFREVFPDEHFLLEHHSSVTWKDPDSPTTAEIRNRLASENWDATLIVTTTVQLFESLLGNTPTACRKLHNIARSVIILDEVQMLPTTLLATILNVLRQLVEHYGVTVVLCTATQPDFDPRPGFGGLPTIREIVPQPERCFERLKRVEYQLPGPSEIWTWEQVARRVQAEEQVLVIVNTRADAVKILDALKPADVLDTEPDPSVFHLSTRLCGAHRRVVLEEVRRRLKAGEPCRLIATQVVEAGVDIDFPLVLRALGPLDRIVQAAGRANREGKRHQGGTVIVFFPQDGGVPPGPYKTGTDITRILLKKEYADLHDPTLYQEYFHRYYSEVDLDNKQIEATRARYDYPEVSRKFHMIEDDQFPIVVRYSNRLATEEAIGAWLNELRTKPNRALLRALQPYIVNLRPLELKKAQQQGSVEEVLPGLWEWYGHYDGVYGIVMDGVQNAEHNVW